MKYKKTNLKNGLRIITAPMKGTQTATIFIAVSVGSRYEEENEAGLSHFIEHMMFKGTRKRPIPRKIYEELDAIGGTFNAFTGKSRTAYYAKVDAKHIETAMDVLTDMFLNSKIAGQEINREKGTILQELSMYEDLPMQSIEDDFEKLLYGKQKLGRSIIGYKKTIANFQRKDFVNYMDKFYTAKDTVVCVAGKINERKIIAQLKRYFSKMKKGKQLEIEKVIEKQATPKIKIKYKKTDQTHLVLGVRAYNDQHKDRYVLSLLANILGGNMSSRLFIQVRERQGLAYYVRAGGEAYQDVGYLSASAGVEHKNLTRAVETILVEFKKISRRKISEKELQKAKDYIQGKMIMGLESSDAVAGFLTEQEIIKNEIKKPQEIFRKINAVTREDILRVAKDIFVPEKLNLAIIGPHKDSKKLEKILQKQQ
jgi:predicted Zn-dependent peptidase